MPYVYRYMIGDEWIYVGKASRSVSDRVKAHAKEEKFYPFLSQCSISFLTFESIGDMATAESALIKAFKPKLNIADKTEYSFPIQITFDDTQWKEYKENEFKKRKFKHFIPMVDFDFLKNNRQDIIKWESDFDQLCYWQEMKDFTDFCLSSDFSKADINTKVFTGLQRVTEQKIAVLRKMRIAYKVEGFSINGQLIQVFAILPFYRDEWNKELIRLINIKSKRLVFTYKNKVDSIQKKLGGKSNSSLYDHYCAMPGLKKPEFIRPNQI